MKSILRAFGVIGLILLAGAVAIGVLRQGEGPNPITDPEAWVVWARADAITAFLLLIAAFMTGIGAVAALMQIVGSKPLSDQQSRRAHDRIRDEAANDASATRDLVDGHGAASADRDAVMLGHVQRLGEQIADLAAAQGRPLNAETQARTEAALTAVGLSDSPELATARTAVQQEDPAAVVDALIASASSEGAERLREAGAIAFGFDVGKSLLAYSRAAVLDPANVWTHIFLGRLHRAAGDLTAARAAAEASLAAAVESRDRSSALNELGNVARAEGDLSGARKAYEDGLVIAKDRSARDPKNTDWRRDLSVSHSKLGDLARAEGDLPGARQAYEDALVIAKDLSTRDPKNTEWLRDLSVSHSKLGDVAVAEGDLPGARLAFEDDLVIAKDLSARDPKNTEWRRDLSVSFERIGDLARAEGDLPGARKAYEDGLVIRRELSERDPKNTEWLRDLSVSYNRLGDVAVAEGDLPGARQAYEDDLVIAKDLSARDPKNSGWLRDLSVSYNKIGDLARAEGDLPGARKAYEDGLVIARALSARDPSNADWRRDVWNSLWRLARLGDSDVSWSDVRDAISAEKARGCLLKDDERFLVEAERHAAG